MKRIQMVQKTGIAFKEGCEKYLDDCRQRNLREGTMRHYKQSYTQFYKVISPDLPLEEFTEKTYTDYVKYLVETLHNDVSINSYLVISMVCFWKLMLMFFIVFISLILNLLCLGFLCSLCVYYTSGSVLTCHLNGTAVT